MSSHHIVRDKQEPALMIANGDSCNGELMGQLLEWSPYVLVLDGALDRVLQRGIKVDAVLGDFDSVSVQRLSTDQEQMIEWIHKPEQDNTDFDKGVIHLIENNHSAVNVIWATGRRMDHTFNNILSMARFSGQINITLWDDHSKAFILQRSYKKYYPAGTTLSLLPITQVMDVKTQGLRYNLEGENLHVPDRTGNSNEVVSDGIVEIHHEEGLLCLMECFDTSIS